VERGLFHLKTLISMNSFLGGTGGTGGTPISHPRACRQAGAHDATDAFHVFHPFHPSIYLTVSESWSGTEGGTPLEQSENQGRAQGAALQRVFLEGEER
jgi:hypothetical protein